MKKFLLLLSVVALSFTGCYTDDLGPDEPVVNDIVLSQDRVEVENSGASVSIAVTSDYPWSATTSNEWIVVETSNGDAGESRLRFSVAANETTAQRNGSILVYCDSYNLSAELTVVQAAGTGEDNPDSGETPDTDEWVLLTDANGNQAKGKFRGNDLFTSLFNIDANVEIDVNVYEHKSRKGYYKFEDPWALSLALGFGYDSVAELEAEGVTITHADFLIDASNPNQVVFEQQEAGVDIGYGPMVVESGYPTYLDAASGAGTLVDGVITFPTKGCIIAMPSYSSNAYYANNNGMFRLMLPGAVVEEQLPACKVTLAVGPVSAVYPELSQQYPDETSLVYGVQGADIASAQLLIAPTNLINEYIVGGAILEDLIRGCGEDLSSKLSQINGDGYINIATGLEPGTSYTVAVYAQNVYGNSNTAMLGFTTSSASSANPCNIDGVMMLPSQFDPAYTASYPDQSSLFLRLMGSEIRSMKYYLNTSEVVSTWTDTPEALVATYGADFPASTIESINSNGVVLVPFKNLSADTEYTAIISAVNIYGEIKTLVFTGKTAADNYTGELVVGDYSMYCKYVYGNEAAGEFMESSNVFTLASNGGSHTDFLVTNIGIKNGGTTWNAKYDSAAGTLTLDGTELGYESSGNLFGELYGYADSAQTMAYGFFSYASAESNGNDPLVLTVDPSTKQLSGLATEQFSIEVYQLSDGSLLGYYAYFVNSLTEIAPYTATRKMKPATLSAKSLSPMVRAPFSSVKIDKSLLESKSKFKSLKVADVEVIDGSSLMKNTLKSVKSVPVQGKVNMMKLRTLNLKAEAVAMQVR